MFICGLCNRPSKRGEKAFKVPDKAYPPSATSGAQIKHEIMLAPDCRKRYEEALKAAAPDINPQSAYAALVD